VAVLVVLAVVAVIIVKRRKSYAPKKAKAAKVVVPAADGNDKDETASVDSVEIELPQLPAPAAVAAPGLWRVNSVDALPAAQVVLARQQEKALWRSHSFDAHTPTPKETVVNKKSDRSLWRSSSSLHE